jgi:hypothetical protein
MGGDGGRLQRIRVGKGAWGQAGAEARAQAGAQAGAGGGCWSRGRQGSKAWLVLGKEAGAGRVTYGAGREGRRLPSCGCVLLLVHSSVHFMVVRGCTLMV